MKWNGIRSDRCDPVYSRAMQNDRRRSIRERYFYQYNNINIIIDAINDILSVLLGRNKVLRFLSWENSESGNLTAFNASLRLKKTV